MRRLALALMLAAPLTASAVPNLLPSHVEGLAFASLSTNMIPLMIKEVFWVAGTVTYAAPTNRTAKVTCTADTCSVLPTLESDGADMDDWQGFSVTVEADSGKVLTGVGTINCYTWDGTFGAWSLQQDLGLAIATGCTVRRCTAQGVFVAAPRGRITCLPVGIITNAVGGLVLYINGEKRK